MHEEQIVGSDLMLVGGGLLCLFNSRAIRRKYHPCTTWLSREHLPGINHVESALRRLWWRCLCFVELEAFRRLVQHHGRSCRRRRRCRLAAAHRHCLLQARRCASLRFSLHIYVLFLAIASGITHLVVSSLLGCAHDE